MAANKSIEGKRAINKSKASSGGDPKPAAVRKASAAKDVPKTASKPSVNRPQEAVKSKSHPKKLISKAETLVKQKSSKSPVAPRGKAQASSQITSKATSTSDRTIEIKTVQHPKVSHAKPTDAIKSSKRDVPAPKAEEAVDTHGKVDQSARSSVLPAAQAAVTLATPGVMPKPVLTSHQKPTGNLASVARGHASGTQSKELPRDVIERSAMAAKAEAAAQEAKKKTSQRHGFRLNEYVVYPSHGVGRIVDITTQVVAGHSLEFFVITFEQEKMTLRVPTSKLESVGMRKLSENTIVLRAMEVLKGRARIKRTMWSRRAQEYENKINSGDLIAISEVVRDLYRAETQPEQSYSERQLFEAALDRMSREIAAIEKLDERGAVQKIVDVLAKSARGRAASKHLEDTAALASEGPAVRVA
jgi:CarD family transcriptional regulator